MDFPIHVDKISMELSILYFKGLPVKILYKNEVLLSPKIAFILANSSGPDGMCPYAAFHLDFHCLPVSRMKRIEQK